MTGKSKRPYKGINIMPDDHKRLERLRIRFTDDDRTRVSKVSMPETLRRLMDYYEVNEGIKI